MFLLGSDDFGAQLCDALSSSISYSDASCERIRCRVPSTLTLSLALSTHVSFLPDPSFIAPHLSLTVAQLSSPPPDLLVLVDLTSLAFRAPFPATLALMPHVMDALHRVFRLLLQLKFASRLLSEALLYGAARGSNGGATVAQQQQDESGATVAPLASISAVHRLRFLLQHHVDTFMYHFYHVGVRVTWTEYEENLSRCASLDDVARCTRHMADTMAYRCLLTPRAARLAGIIRGMCNVAVRFAVAARQQEDGRGGRYMTVERVAGMMERAERGAEALRVTLAGLAERGYQPHLQGLAARLGH